MSTRLFEFVEALLHNAYIAGWRVFSTSFGLVCVTGPCILYTSWLWSPLWREGHTCNVSQLGPSSTLYHTIWDSNWYLFSKLWSGVSRLKTNQLHLYKQLKWLQRNYQGPKSGPQHIPHWEALSKHRPGSTVLCDRHPGSLSTKKSDFDRELLVCCDDYHIKTCKSKHRKVRNVLINVHMKDSN